MGAVQRLVQRARHVGAQSTPDVPSPCVSVCRMDPVTELCEGCFRTLDEIAWWARMEDESKREVWRMIEERALTQAAVDCGAGPERDASARA
jgi:predicted Fe-S protein YdhL (DUF1289 family)